jgi:hypothetical protein
MLAWSCCSRSQERCGQRQDFDAGARPLRHEARTSLHRSMSDVACWPIADVASHRGNVRFGPLADIATRSRVACRRPPGAQLESWTKTPARFSAALRYRVRSGCWRSNPQQVKHWTRGPSCACRARPGVAFSTARRSRFRPDQPRPLNHADHKSTQLRARGRKGASVGTVMGQHSSRRRRNRIDKGVHSVNRLPQCGATR